MAKEKIDFTKPVMKTVLQSLVALNDADTLVDTFNAAVVQGRRKDFRESYVPRAIDVLTESEPKGGLVSLSVDVMDETGKRIESTYKITITKE